VLFRSLNIRQYINKTSLKDKFLNFYDEPFYISREFPKISIKQGHLLFKLIKTKKPNNPKLASFDDLATSGPFVVHHRAEYFRFLTKKMVDGTIYPDEILSNFGDDKTKGSLILTSKDDWFNKSNHRLQHKWFQNLNDLVKNNQGLYVFKNNKLKGIRSIASKPYYIGEFNVFENNEGNNDVF